MAQFALLVYDIPTGAGYNARRDLRRTALYINLSCCIVRKDALPHHVIGRLRSVGATYHVADFDTSASEGLLAFAAQNIRQDLANARRRLQETIERGPDADTPDGRARYRTRMRAALTRYRNLLADYRAVTREFNLTINLDVAQAGLTAMDALANRRAEAYCRATASLPEGDAIRAAAEEDAVPEEILADYVQDHGDEEAGMEIINGLEVA